MANSQQLIMTGGVEIDAKIGVSDLAEVFMTEHEDDLLTEKDRLDNELAAIRKDYATVEKELAFAAGQLSEGYQNAEAEAVRQALAAFIGQDYVINIDGGALDVDKAAVRFTLHVLAEKDVKKKQEYQYHSCAFPDVEKSVSVPITGQMQELITQLANLSHRIKDQEDEITKVRRLMADLPRTARRAKAAMIKAVMTGGVATGQELLAAIQQNAKPKALPKRDDR